MDLKTLSCGALYHTLPFFVCDIFKALRIALNVNYLTWLQLAVRKHLVLLICLSDDFNTTKEEFLLMTFSKIRGISWINLISKDIPVR